MKASKVLVEYKNSQNSDNWWSLAFDWLWRGFDHQPNVSMPWTQTIEIKLFRSEVKRQNSQCYFKWIVFVMQHDKPFGNLLVKWFERVISRLSEVYTSNKHRTVGGSLSLHCEDAFVQTARKNVVYFHDTMASLKCWDCVVARVKEWSRFFEGNQEKRL